MGAIIYNSKLTEEIIDGAKIQVSKGGIPGEIAEKVVPVMEVNPKILTPALCLTAFYVDATSAGVTLLSGQTNRDTYITGFNINLQSTIASDNTQTIIQATFDGQIRTIWTRTKPSVTAENYITNISFPTPLKIDKDTNITITQTFTAGTTASWIAVYGYRLDRQ